MSSNRPAPSTAGHTGQPAPAAAVISAAPGPSEHLQLRRLEKTGGWTGHERLRIAWYRLRIAWYRLRLTVQEMNYATRRLVELQTRLP